MTGIVRVSLSMGQKPFQSAILYVALPGTSVRKRVDQYYGTQIGQRSPHVGRWWLKTLADLESLFVDYAEAETPTASEDRLLRLSRLRPAVRTQGPPRFRANCPVCEHRGASGCSEAARHGRTQEEAPEPESSLIPAPRAQFASAPDGGHGPATPVSSSQVGSNEGTLIGSQVITDKVRAGSNLRIPLSYEDIFGSTTA